MPEKVLIYSRFPKALMLRISERFELLDAGGKPPIRCSRLSSSAISAP